MARFLTGFLTGFLTSCLTTVGMTIGGLCVLSRSSVQAIPLSEIQTKAHQITVKIQSDRPSSGVLVAKQGDRYTVLTTKHSVKVEDRYAVVTPDGESHPVEWRSIQNLPDLDLALIEFKSDRTYPIADLSITQPYPGQPLFLMGKADSAAKFTPGSVIPQLQAIPFAKDPFTQGYGLFYSNIAQAGMSGGPVLNSSGQVIAIHGRSEGEEIELPSLNASEPSEALGSGRLHLGYSSGITIRTLLTYQPKLNLTPQTDRLSGLLPEDVQTVDQILRPLMEPPSPSNSGANSAIAWANHANTLYRMGRLPEGIRALQKAIKLSPKTFALRYAEGVMFFTLGRSADAAKAFEQALTLDPTQDRALQGKAIALASLGDTEGALQLLDQTVKLNPRNAIAWYWRGKLMNQLRQSPQAIESLNYATSLQPNFPAAWVEKSKAWDMLGEPIASQAALKEAQKLDAEL
jgi:tetratricopeptide (TPR) repeat protein